MFLIKIFSICLCLGSTLAWERGQRSDAQPLPWWEEEVLYQVYPRSHMDTNSDGVGDIPGIERKLDHFTDIGVGSVWISPMYKSPMKDFGYDISDFRDIEPMFGTMEDFRIMARSMKARGLRLIMDFVPNHTSDQHEWFERSVKNETKYLDYYVWKNSRGNDATGHRLPPNNWLSVFGGPAWTWNDERGQYYLHQFTPEQPDLNFRNRQVVIEILAVFEFWLREGVDGFRMDAVPHIMEDPSFADERRNPNSGDALCEPEPWDHSCLIHDKTYDLNDNFELLATFRKLLDQQSALDGKERVMMVESTVYPLSRLFLNYGNKSQPIAHYPFNFDFMSRVPTGNFNGNHIAAVVNDWFRNLPEDNVPCWIMSNHDNHRVGSRFGEENIDAMNMINLLLPGAAVTYYGEEIGMMDADISWEDTVDPPACRQGRDRYHLFSRDPERTPMQWNGRERHAGFSGTTADKPWLPMHPNWQQGVNVEDQRLSTTPSHLQIYKEIVALRKTNMWRYGALQDLAFDNGDMYGFTRIYKTEAFVVVCNFGDETKNVNLTRVFNNVATTAEVHLTSKDFVPQLAIGSTVLTDQVQIGRKHAIILKYTSDDPDVTSPTTTPTTTPTTAAPPTTTDGASSVVIGTSCLLISLLFSAFARH